MTSKGILNNVLVSDLTALLNRIPDPSLVKEDKFVLYLSDADYVKARLGEGANIEAVGTLHKITLKKGWTSKGVDWFFCGEGS